MNVTLNPDLMVTVTLDTPDGPRTLNVIMCDYVQTSVPQEGQPPRRGVRVRLIYDNLCPAPARAYQRDARDLTVEHVAPAALKTIRPYEAPR